MRADRVLSMLMLLQKNGRMRAHDLAIELEVSERTIYRDMEALSISGVPIFTERGPRGGIELLGSYRSDLTGLNQNEIRALFMLGSPSHLADLGLDIEYKQAMRKLAATLPQDRVGDQERSRRFFVDPKPWEDTTSSIPLLSVLQIAVWEERSLSIIYRSILGDRIGTLKSIINPYGLASKDNKWYVVAKREEHIIILELDRLIDVKIEQTKFDYPEDFDLSVFWQEWIATQNSSRPRFETTLEVFTNLISYLANKFDCNFPEVNQAMPAVPDRVEVKVTFSSFEEARKEILSLGRGIKVTSPKALQLSVADFAKQVAAMYG